MFFNYLKIAIRTLKRKMVYTIINVLGLSAGLVCVVFIYNWVQDELSYDKHFPKKEQIYRIAAEVRVGADEWHQTVTSLPLAPTVEKSFPEVIGAVRLKKNEVLIEKDEQQFIESYVVFTDPDFFEVFDYHLLIGNESSALTNPYQIVLTESMAKKYFGDENPLGRSLILHAYDTTGNGAEYEVTGIVADPPANSHFTFNILSSLSTLASVNPGEMENWGNNSYHSYLLLEKNASAGALEEKLKNISDEYVGISNESFYNRFYLQPIESIYLNSNILYEFKANGKKEFIWIFSSIGVFILLLAAINYINLSTSFSMERAKETGVRKVLGARRTQLIYQHLLETLVLTFLSLILAGLLIEILKPLFYNISGKSHISIDYVELILQLLVICIPVGLVAGYFPARMLSKMSTIKSLKGRIFTNSYGGLRNVLVTVQFAITIVILVGLVVVSRQMDYVFSKELGYNRNNLVLIRANNDVRAGFKGFKNELLEKPGVSNVAHSGNLISFGLSNGTGKFQNENGENQFVKLYRLTVDYNYIDTYGMELITGRNFSPEVSSDSTRAFVINEKAAASYGWTPEEAIGKELHYSGRKGNIIGVTKDFHFNSLRHEIEPVCMYISDYFYVVNVKGDDTQKLVASIEEVWKNHYPNAILDYGFQDELLYDSYQEDLRFGNIINVFSVLSVIIAFLGLFGLVSYTVSRKTKEISIRKVLGASVNEILALISGKFLRLILMAAVIAFPFAWWIMSEWLNKFPYHMNMSIWIFIIVGVIIFILSLALISAQTFKTAMVNPAETLNED